SPTTAWISPRATVRLTSRLATTPGNRLVMPRSSTADGSLTRLPRSLGSAPSGAQGEPERARDRCGSRARSRSMEGARGPLMVRLRSRRNLELAVGDLLGEGIEVGDDVVVQEVARRRVPDALGLEVEVLDTADVLAVDECLDGLEDRVVDPLHHRGEDVLVE